MFEIGILVHEVFGEGENYDKLFNFAAMYDYNRIYKSFMAGDVTPFYENLYPGLLVYASHRLGSDLSYLAEDCVQDAVMSSYSERKRFVNSAAWYAYIIKCIYHNTVAVLRKSQSHSNYMCNNDAEDTTTDLDTDLLEQELLDRLYAAVESLPLKYREVLQMSYFDGLKNAEIAARMGVAEITVKKWKAAIISQLRNTLDDTPDGRLTSGIGESDCFSILLFLVMLRYAHAIVCTA